MSRVTYYSRSTSVPWAERWLVAQTISTVVLCSWAMGGRASWAPTATLGASVLSIIPLAFIWRARRSADSQLSASLSVSRRPVSCLPSPVPCLPSPVSCLLSPVPRFLLPFLPLALFSLYIGISLLNPSHVPAPNGGWVPRDGWIYWLPTTIDRDRTIQGMLPWLAALFQAGAVAAGLRSKRSSRALTLGLVANVLLLAVVGSFFWFDGAKQMLGAIPVRAPYFFATFAYRNHWAAFALLGAATAAGVAFAAWDRVREDRRARDVRLFGFCAVLLILLTVPLPGSRSGTVLASVLTLLILVMAVKRVAGAVERSRRWRAGAMAGLAVVILGIAGWVVSLDRPALEQGWRRTVGQWALYQSDGKYDTRPASARDTWRMAQVRPWFGWGAGSFGAVFPLFQGDYGRDASGRITEKFNAAHSDWVQLPAEFGFVGSTILVGSAAAALVSGLRSGDRGAKWILFGCALVALYAAGDFPLQNPAVLLLTAVLLAAAAKPLDERKVQREIASPAVPRQIAIKPLG